MTSVSRRDGRRPEVRAQERPRRRRRILIAMMAAAVALAVFDLGVSFGGRGVRGTSSVGRGLPPASQVRAMKGTDLDGRPVTVSSFAGRALVVNFFGSWCPPCRREASVFPAVAREFGGRVSFLSVAVSDSAASDRAFAERYGWTWSIVEDNGYRWSVAFDLLGLPGTYVLDARGRVVDRIVGPVALSRLSAALRPVVPAR